MNRPNQPGTNAPSLPGFEDLAPALPSVTLTPTGAVGLDEIDADGASLLLRSVETASSAVNWLIGDLALEQMVRAMRGDTSLDTVAMPTDQAQARRALYVSIAFPHDRRRPALSWSHHETVRKLAETDQAAADRWLETAELEGWSVAVLRDRVREAAAAPAPPLPGITPWPKEHRATVTAIAKVFAQDPSASVLVHGDGRWEKVEGARPGVAPVVDIRGTEQAR